MIPLLKIFLLQELVGKIYMQMIAKMTGIKTEQVSKVSSVKKIMQLWAKGEEEDQVRYPTKSTGLRIFRSLLKITTCC